MTETVFDIAALEMTARAETGAVLQLRHPGTHEEVGVSIKLQGADADAYRAVVRRQIDEQIAQSKPELSAAELEERHVARLVAVTLGWENVTYHGKTLDFNAANAQRLYVEQIWIREQVARFVEDRSRFLAA